MSEKNEPFRFSRLAEQLIGDFRQVPDETPARMKKRETKGMDNLVGDLLVKYKIGIESPEHVIRDHWKEVVGPAAHYSHAANIDPKGRLIVLASQAVARNEIFLHRKIIVEKIKKLPGCAHVRDLNIRAG